jgi:hypothetical protein
MQNPSCEAVDSLHLADTRWRADNKWCYPLGHFYPTSPKKLQQSGAAATMVAPRWQKSVAPSPYQVGVPRDGHAGLHSLVPSREAAWTRYNRQASIARQCLPDSLPVWLYFRRGAVGAILTMFNTRHIKPATQSFLARAAKVHDNIDVAGCNNP